VLNANSGKADAKARRGDCLNRQGKVIIRALSELYRTYECRGGREKYMSATHDWQTGKA
jgi:hypothetical protein